MTLNKQQVFIYRILAHSSANYNFLFAFDRPELGGWPMAYKLALLKLRLISQMEFELLVSKILFFFKFFIAESVTYVSFPPY